ncbi:MAG TPA: TIGR02391 family protein [Polyangiaceae bacterium]|nr:TIGR02391 family protein [Polyangiaceae bacterium]
MEKILAASELEAVAFALGDTVQGLSGTEIGNLLSLCKMTDPSPDLAKRFRIYNAFAAKQNQSQNRRAILEFIRQAMKPERYARAPEKFEQLRANLNRVLAFCGLAVDAAGKLSETTPAATIDEAARRAQELRTDLTSRGVHPDVLKFCRAELLAKDHFHAVLEATKSIFDKIRSKTGFTEDGAPLVDRAFAGEAPKLAINPLMTESQRSEQKGFANLLKGTFGMFRNPTAHEARIHWDMGKDDAEDLLSLASMIHRRLDAAAVV